MKYLPRNSYSYEILGEKLNKLKNNSLLEHGYIKKYLAIPTELLNATASRDWKLVDQLISKYLLPGNFLHDELYTHHQFNHTEHIIAIRNGEDDDDGIWHDDGSRDLAFTWSLNEVPELIVGGELLFCKKGDANNAQRVDVTTIMAPLIGVLVIFLTGAYGFEHKVNRVREGERKTIAGWCSSISSIHPKD